MNPCESSSPSSSSSSPTFNSLPGVPDWDEPFTDDDLRAIDEAVLAAVSVKKRQPISPEDAAESPPRSRRRLPSSVCLTRRSFNPLACRARNMTRCPIMKFGGRTIYSRTRMEVEKAAIELSDLLQAKKREMGSVAVGFDIEWKPSFRRGVPPGKAAVMQICCGADHCNVMHIIHSGIPRSLRLFLEDSTIIKVGIGIRGDAFKVFYDYKISIKGVEDLSSLANKKLDGDPHNWGLQSLTEKLISKQLLKPNHIRLGNWEVDILSTEQIQYAATDAFASWHLFEVLSMFPDVEKDVACSTVKSHLPQ